MFSSRPGKYAFIFFSAVRPPHNLKEPDGSPSVTPDEIQDAGISGKME
jgi:hypothetical protein